MPRKRSEAEGSKGDGEVGGRLARGVEVSLERPGQDQSADAGRCRGSGVGLCHPSPPAGASWRAPGHQWWARRASQGSF